MFSMTLSFFKSLVTCDELLVDTVTLVPVLFGLVAFEARSSINKLVSPVRLVASESIKVLNKKLGMVALTFSGSIIFDEEEQPASNRFFYLFAEKRFLQRSRVFNFFLTSQFFERFLCLKGFSESKERIRKSSVLASVSVWTGNAFELMLTELR